ncbi:ATP-grasp domain-containing protein [Metabacillus litoralis]|uniref:ATP-grasp domain-containing protein n=1 Tax=Metabacillus litoralis TaxID=152268 RepID=UPI00203FE09C|nr:ATP-grasp domain-containing protein [Metabacillus litoralis]MCM3163755.1 ATP-grasp domain-containing protein [Metabacillus litoralis]
MGKKIMILGASILQLPAILKAKDMGLEVIAVDMDVNAIGFNYSDICLEISTIDTQKVVEAAKRYKIDAIMTLASDMPMRTVAAVTEELNIVGINKNTAINVTNKAAMRMKLKEYNVPIPEFFRVETYIDFKKAVDGINSKFIVKPADNSGSRGVILVDDKHNEQLINSAFEYSMKYSRSGEIVVEEFMEGPEVSVETLSFGGKNHVIAITDKLTTGAPKFVEMGHSIPSQLSAKNQSAIEKVVFSAINAVGINNGPSHTEVILTKDGPKIVELGARLGGDNITTHLVPLATGIDLLEACIQIALGNKPIVKKSLSKGSAIRYINANNGTINKIKGVDQTQRMNGVKHVYLMKEVGNRVLEVMNSNDRIGYVISQSHDAQSAIEICESALNNIEICIQDGGE